MCKFYDSIPSRSKMTGTNKRRNLALFLKPCPDEKTFYRFRLLNFGSDGKNDRDYPFIKRFLHTKWGKNDKGQNVIIDQVTCPVTPHVHVEGNRYQACKICDIAGKYFGTYKASNYTDKEAGRKNKEFSRKLEWIIPVYVVNDPQYDGNNGKFKVIIFDNKETFEDFEEKVKKATLTNRVFNGENAVDCCIHMSQVDQVVREGTPDEFVWHRRVIDRIIFTTKPYTIPSITKEAVSNMGFDEEYYTSSSPAELLDFYNKYCKIATVDVPEDDIPMFDTPSTPAAPTPAPVVSNPKPPVSPSNDISESELNDLTKDLGFSTPVTEVAPCMKLAPSNTFDAPTISADTSSAELDSLLDGIDL